MERVWGPISGFYVAAYAAPAADGESFCSYAKVCWTRPDNYWDGDCAFKVFGGEQHRTLQDAMDSVALDARHQIASLPAHARALAKRRQRDHREIPRLYVTTFFRYRLA
jgi:hypothetical protein